MDRSKASPWPLVAIILAVVLMPLNSTMIAVGLEPMATALKVPEASVVWVVTSYLVVQAALQPIAGKLGDLFGRRRLLLLGLAIFLTSSVLAASLPNLTALIFFRSGQAVGGALVVPSAMALLRQLYQGDALRRVLGSMGLIQGMGAAVGPLVGAALIHVGGWTYMFWINLPFAATALILGAKRLPKAPAAARRAIDYWGSMALASFLTVLALAVPHQAASFSSMEVGAILLASALLAGFVLAERKAADPVVHFSFFRRAPFRSANLAVLASNFFMYSTLLYMPVFLRHRGLSTSATGLLLFIFSLSMSLMSYMGGHLGRRFGARRVIALAFSLDLGVVLWYVGLSHVATMSYLLAGLIVAGIGAGIGNVAMQATLLEAVSPAMAGSSSGIYSTFRYVGSITASALVSLMISSLWAHVLFLALAALLGFVALSGFPGKVPSANPVVPEA